jgi:hypothetical protein
MYYVVLSLGVLLPSVLYAQTTVLTIINMLKSVLDDLVRVGLAVALTVFVWGVVKIIMAMNGFGSDSGDVGKVIAEGKQRMVWGIIILFVIVSIWGLVTLLSEIFGISSVATQATPIITW